MFLSRILFTNNLSLIKNIIIIINKYILFDFIPLYNGYSFIIIGIIKFNKLINK